MCANKEDQPHGEKAVAVQAVERLKCRVAKRAVTAKVVERLNCTVAKTRADTQTHQRRKHANTSSRLLLRNPHGRQATSGSTAAHPRRMGWPVVNSLPPPLAR
eukprot:TRINITY_DN5196_c0_g1_i1.p1 TRINITY_DN5196_c0_g1~~TRINITY_DN5196_c0_g1_i1.p1  ORF type:complete len:103 (+),score=9.90 TRINITY_DN5196_c0_g1_i1:161-469(+)